MSEWPSNSVPALRSADPLRRCELTYVCRDVAPIFMYYFLSPANPSAVVELIFT